MTSKKSDAHTSRRSVLAASAAAGGLLAAGWAGRVLADAGVAKTIRLSADAGERDLPARLWGYNSPAPYVPYDTPDFVPAVKALGPHFLRFPGGTVGNYYNWHHGFMEVPDAGSANSVYREMLVHRAMPAQHKVHPEGFFVEDFDRIAKAVDANLIIMANLETSTPDDQAAWFVDMRKKGVNAQYVEMGTEFFFAMRDEMGRKKFPNPEYTTKLTKQFVDAIRPKLPSGAKIAVQSSASAFELSREPTPADAQEPNDFETLKRIWEWDRALKAEPWFDAVTLHLYPKEVASAGMDLVKKLPATTDQVFDAMIARADGGFDTAINDIAARVPGKEIWLSEYGAFDPMVTFYNMDLHFNGLWLHQATRELLAMTRHPQVTVSCFHALKGDGSLTATFKTVGGKLLPVNAALVQSWFFHASRGPGVTWQRMKIEGATQIAAHAGLRPDQKYWDVDAGIFRKGPDHVLFVHNTSKTPRRVDLSKIVSPNTSLKAETVATPDLLASLEGGAPVPQPLATSPALVVPAYSITRVAWTA
jgi:hypothetical protein